MVYPMMEVTKFGVNIESTIIEGLLAFRVWELFYSYCNIYCKCCNSYDKTSWFFYFFIFKINVKVDNKTKNLMFKFIEAIGKWSMIDIYVVAILASIVQLDEVFNIKGGIAATSFCF